MRELICRFNSKEDVDSLKLSGLEPIVTEYSLDNGEVLGYRPSSMTKPMMDKNDCLIHYRGMPEFQSKKIEPYQKVVFKTNKDSASLSKIFDQPITDKTKSIWYPKQELAPKSNYVVVGGYSDPKYPIYVVSKGRSETCLTSRFLSQMGVKHFVIVEEQEEIDYRKNLDLECATILILHRDYQLKYDVFSNIGSENGTGPGPARNFAWDHSKNLGYKWHWVMDDNAGEGFFWLYQNYKIKMRTGGFFACVEDFVNRYDNIAIAGLNYSKFCKEQDRLPPYVMNTRIYSFLLIRNDIDYRWRGRYNEDTDLSLRVLKDGWCTVQFNSFLAGKNTTQRNRGGNTDEFYAKEGTSNKSKMLKDMHPDVTELVYKFGRDHHIVDYSGFTQKLNPIIDLDSLDSINNYGLEMVELHEVDMGISKKEIDSKYGDYFSGPDLPEFRTYKKKSRFFK